MLCEHCHQTIKTLLLEGDFGADPLWCGHCHANLELEQLPLDESLLTELTTWMCNFGEWIDLETDSFIDGMDTLAKSHDVQGEDLAKKVAEAFAMPVIFKSYL
ncbi:hypothetical protein [Lysinibacillus varians]|uniref:Uncharacterized protein n=1 Tax=Lysinibacillus varians TaxID=1145276 RepID=A0ABY2TEG1_9BACI|nr:hypothetical protein [Lysinibacillus varians]AHN20626.1 hypothetical protein T479_03525 [Lysinibacillus varians]TKI66937.1 hypothetical protein FC752_03365 [Lysinibacillus varians]